MTDNYEIQTAQLLENVKNLSEDLKDFKNRLDKFEDKMDNTFVNKAEFSPVKNVVYGMVGLILITFLVGILKFVVVK